MGVSWGGEWHGTMPLACPCFPIACCFIHRKVNVTSLETSRFLSRNQKGVVVAVQVIRDEGARRERESRLRPARWAISIIGVFNNWRNV